jgi:hypothetical protein
MGENIVERLARELLVSRGAAVVASDEHWPEQAKRYRDLCEIYPDYADAHSLINDAFRDAKIAVKATLAALREPSDAMIEAGLDYGTIEDGADLSNVFTQMIDRLLSDTALTEGNEG